MFRDEVHDVFGSIGHSIDPFESQEPDVDAFGQTLGSGNAFDLFTFLFDENVHDDTIQFMRMRAPKPNTNRKEKSQTPVIRPINTFAVRETRTIPINQPRQKVIIKGSEDEEFVIACKNAELKINPHKLGFIPSSFWSDSMVAFGDIYEDFFKRKNHQCCRFRHKLYNAIVLSEKMPELRKFVGLKWVSKSILKVDKHRFGRLLGITSVEGGLFHRQGNFSTHGFTDAPVDEIRAVYGQDAAVPSEHDSYRLLIHGKGTFVQGVTEKELERCKWVSWRKR